MLPETAFSKVQRTYTSDANYPVSAIAFPSTVNSGYKKLRNWQDRAYRQVKDKRRVLIVAMPGSGKTTLQIVVPIQRIIDSGFKHKVVIAVPRTMIGQGFTNDGDRQTIGIELDGKRYDWVVDTNLVDDSSTSKTAELTDFLNNEVPDCYGEAFERDALVSGCICVTTHPCLSTVSARTSDADMARMMKNTTFIIDEAHHIKGVFDVFDDAYDVEKIEGTEAEANRLGSFVHRLVNQGDESTYLMLASAYPFRADKQPVIYPAVREQFKDGIFVLPFLEFFNTLSIKRIDMQYALYDRSPVDAILASIRSEPKECHLIPVPAEDRSWRRIGGELERLLAGLREIFKEEEVLDLVPTERREARKDRLMAEPKNDPSAVKLRAVVHVALVNEGTDWPSCSRLHNASFGTSLPNELQKIGRMLRTFPGKERIVATAYLHNFLEDPEDGTDDLNNLNTALLVGMQYDDMCHPIFLPEDIVRTLRSAGKLPPAATGSSTENPKELPEEPVDRPTIEELFGGQMSEVHAEIARQVEAIRVKDEKHLAPVIEGILDRFQVAPEARAFAGDALRLIIVRTCGSQVPELRHLNVEYLKDIGFDRLMYSKGLVTSSMYTCELQEEDLRELRKRLSFAVASAESLKAKVYEAKLTIDPSGAQRERKTYARKVRAKLENKVTLGRATHADKALLASLYPTQVEGKDAR